MRVLILAACALALTSCDSGAVPSPAEQADQNPSELEVAANEVVVRGGGLIAGTDAFYFAAGKNEVESALVRTLGEAGDSGENAECGAGPIAYSSYPGGLTVNFKDGNFVGWNWTQKAENITLAGGLAIGASRAAIEAENGFAPIENSTLGEEFALGKEIGGFFEEGELSMLYSGTQCFFR